MNISTGEDLGYKPSAIEQAKFEYSPLGKIFNKGLNEDDKKERLFKRLRNIDDKNEKQLDTNVKSISYFSQLSTKEKELFEKLKKRKNDIDPEKFVCVKTDGTIFNFNKFKNSLDLASERRVYLKMQKINKTK